MKNKKPVFPALFVLTIVLLVVLTACGQSTAVQTDADNSQAGELAKIDFAQVEVGLGSPTPVSVTIDVSYPSTCAQLSQVSQRFETEGDMTKILIEIRVKEIGGICNEDTLSFRMVLPINASALPKGVYQVEVNGVDGGNFEFKN